MRGAPEFFKTLQCCTCDGEEGPCAVTKVVCFAVQEQDAAFEPALVLQGQPIHQQGGTLGKRHAACGRKGEGGRAKRKVWEKTERQKVSTYTARQAESADAGRGLTTMGTQSSSVTKATVKVMDFM